MERMNEKNQLIVIALDKWGKVPDSLELVEIVLKLEKEKENLRDYAADLDSENDNQAIEIEELKKENKNLKRELEDTKQVSERDYNIVQNDNNILRNENKKLKEENEILKEYKLMYEGLIIN